MSDKHHRVLAEMEAGQRGVIVSLTEDPVSQILMEMGCLPGEMVTVARIAPLGDPISIKINGATISLRKSEAAAVIIAEEE